MRQLVSSNEGEVKKKQEEEEEKISEQKKILEQLFKTLFHHLTDSIQGSSGYCAEVSINLDSKDNQESEEKEKERESADVFL